jgi:hypothetical protein
VEELCRRDGWVNTPVFGAKPEDAPKLARSYRSAT